MSVKGSKSRLYVREPVPAATVDTLDTIQHVTAQELTGNKVGLDVVIHGLYSTHVIAKVIEAGSVRRKIVITGHGARRGDVLKIDSGAEAGQEVTILEVEDANIFYIAYEIPISVGDQVFIKRHITPDYDENGALAVSTGPTQFISNGVNVQNTVDSVTPLNNIISPSKIFIEKDNLTLPVRKDSVTPANTLAIPVEIVSASGTNINITAGDINIQSSDLGVNYDAHRVGDGSGNYLGINISNEAKVNDGSANTKLTSIITSLGTLLTELQLKADLLETQPVSMASAPSGASLEATQLLVKAKTDNLDVLLSTRAKDSTLTDATQKTRLYSENKGTNISEGISSYAPDANTSALHVAEVYVRQAYYNESLVIDNATPIQILAPALAKWCKIEADDANVSNLRVKIGGATATVSSGMQFQAGRSEDFQVAGDISVIAEIASTNQKIYVTFGA